MILSRVIPVLIILLMSAVPARSNEIGIDFDYSNRERRFDGAGDRAVDSSIKRIRNQLFWKQQFSDTVEAWLQAEQEDWRLRGEAGLELIVLRLKKFRPRLKYGGDNLSLDASLLALDITREPAQYIALDVVQDDDTDSSFLLPALNIKYAVGRWFLRSGYWEEHDIITLITPDGNRYAVILIENVLVGGGLEFTKHQTLELKLLQSKRSYPESLQLTRDEYSAAYRLKSPLSNAKEALWREFSVQFSNKTFPASGEDFKEVLIENHFKFKTGSITNFMTYRLRFSDSFVAYNKVSGSDDFIVEETFRENELIQFFGYEGFRKLGESPVFLAWGLRVEDSLIRNAFVEIGGHIKATLTF